MRVAWREKGAMDCFAGLAGWARAAVIAQFHGMAQSLDAHGGETPVLGGLYRVKWERAFGADDVILVTGVSRA